MFFSSCWTVIHLSENHFSLLVSSNEQHRYDCNKIVLVLWNKEQTKKKYFYNILLSLRRNKKCHDCVFKVNRLWFIIVNDFGVEVISILYHFIYLTHQFHHLRYHHHHHAIIRLEFSLRYIFMPSIFRSKEIHTFRHTNSSSALTLTVANKFLFFFTLPM